MVPRQKKKGPWLFSWRKFLTKNAVKLEVNRCANEAKLLIVRTEQNPDQIPYH